MDEQTNKIIVLFTATANSTLDDIIKEFNLQETPEISAKKNAENKYSNNVVIKKLAKKFSVGGMTEKDLTSSLQKDLGVSQQTAEQISKKVITGIIPYLEKVEEEKLKNPVFVDELDRRVFGTLIETKKETVSPENTDISPKIEPSKDANIVTNVAPTKKLEKAKKPTIQENIEKAVTQTKQKKSSDSYREPIE